MRTRGFTLIGVIIVGGLAGWGGVLCYDLARAPVSNVRHHDYAVALANVLDLQALALREAQRGEPSFFVGHIGCAAPNVWQNPKVLANLKQMVEAGVELKLIAGEAGPKEGQVRPKGMVKWLDELEDKLKDLGIDPKVILLRLPRELPSHSLVAGSARRARGYITSPEADDNYPSLCFTVREQELSQVWKNYLISKCPPSRE